jgi:hypothetical protein
MKTILERTATSLHLSGDEENAVRSAYGPEHPFARAITRQRTVALQLVATLIAVGFGVAGVVEGTSDARIVLGVAGAVGVLLVLYAVSMRTSVRVRADELIAEGREDEAVQVLALERRRLASRALRERLARSLERCLLDAERLLEIHPSFRLPYELRYLRFVASDVREVAALLRSDSAQIRGVAATAAFVNGDSSPLFEGDVDRLRRELRRLRKLLAPDEPERVAA